MAFPAGVKTFGAFKKRATGVASADHYLVVFKEDNVKAIVSHGEIRDCDNIVRGASCEALWKDAKHKEWYPAFMVDIRDLEYLRSLQSKPKEKNQKSRTTACKTAGTKESAKKRKMPDGRDEGWERRLLVPLPTLECLGRGENHRNNDILFIGRHV